jgi:CubicO group peptidase (beta-lactamase class C family)
VASLSKLFTTIAALQLLPSSRLVLNATVASYIPGFAVNGKDGITIQQLMTHTSGFDADPNPSLWQGYGSVEERKKAVLEEGLVAKPGEKYLYSDLSEYRLNQRRRGSNANKSRKII